MRRLLATLTVLLACLFGLPAPAPATTALTPIGGGSVLFTLDGHARCIAAFAAVSRSSGYLLAGPGCAGATKLYSGNDVLVGPAVAGGPGGLLTLVNVTNTAAWRLVPWIPVGSGQVVIAGSAETPVGGSVCLIDLAAGLRCGVVTAKNQTVVFPGGAVYGLTRTNICLLPHTAVAFVSGGQAQGVPIGGTSNCASGGTSFFLPVNPLLRDYGLTLLTG